MEMLGILSIYSILIPLAIGIIFFKKMSKDSLLIWGVVIIGTIPQLMKAYFDSTQVLCAIEKKRLLAIAYNLYVLIEFGLLFFLFKDKFYHKISNKIFTITAWVYFILSLSIIYFNGINQRFLNELISVNSLIYTAWILMIVVEQYSAETMLNITLASPIFWFLTGLFLYASGTIMSFLLWPSSQKQTDYISNVLKVIHAIFNINLYIFFSIGFLKDIFWRTDANSELQNYPDSQNGTN